MEGQLSTAGGLVFCAGARDNKLWGLRQANRRDLMVGEIAVDRQRGTGDLQVNGRQFVVIAATGGNKLGTPYGDAYVAFALAERGD